MSESSGVRPPLQDRSQKTFVALLDAAEELLDERLFSDVSVQEIVDRAGSSAGAFYGRFSSKHALLLALQDRLHAVMEAGVREVPDGWVEGGVSIELVAGSYVDKLTAYHRSSQGVIRALMTGAQTDTTIIEKSMGLHNRVAEITAPYWDAPGRSLQEKSDAIEAAGTVLIGVLNQRMLYSGGMSGDSLTLTPDEASPAEETPTRDRLVDIFLAALDL